MHCLSPARERGSTVDAELDLDRHHSLPVNEEKIHLGPRLRPPEKRFRPDEARGGPGDQLFYDEPLEGGAAAGPRRQLFRLSEPREEVEEARVSQVDLRALREPFLDVRVVRSETAKDERLLEHVEVGRYGVRRHAERPGQVRHVQQVSVDVRQHRPEEAKAGGREPNAERGEVALEERGDVRVEPLRSSRRGPSFVHGRIATPEPALAGVGRTVELGREEGRQLDEPDAAREALRDGRHERGARRARQDVSAPARVAVDGRAQGGEELREPLCFVEHDLPRMAFQEALDVRSDDREVGGAFEVEDVPALSPMADESALAALARPENERYREVAEERGKTSCSAACKELHALYFGTIAAKCQGKSEWPNGERRQRTTRRVLEGP